MAKRYVGGKKIDQTAPQVDLSSIGCSSCIFLNANFDCTSWAHARGNHMNILSDNHVSTIEELALTRKGFASACDDRIKK